MRVAVVVLRADVGDVVDAVERLRGGLALLDRVLVPNPKIKDRIEIMLQWKIGLIFTPCG